MVVPSSTATLLASAFILFTGAPTHGQTAIPDADRFIKLGTRIAPLRAGEGGQLTLTAPAALCTDARHLLEVRFFSNPGREMPVVRMFTGPSPCRWDFDAMAAGYYAAVIQEANDGPVVAQARGQVWQGVTTEMTLASSDVEVEGRIAGELSVPGGVRLAFETNGSMGGRTRWIAPLNVDGTYRVKLTGHDLNDPICVYAEPSGLHGAEPATTQNRVLIKCARFSNGPQRFDVDDVHLPPGIVRIEVPPVENAAFDTFADLTVSIAGTPGPTILHGFKLLRGLYAEYFCDYRERQFAVVSHGGAEVLASSRLTLSPERPLRIVTLTTAAHR